jgi:hypothetical protein
MLNYYIVKRVLFSIYSNKKSLTDERFFSVSVSSRIRIFLQETEAEIGAEQSSQNMGEAGNVVGNVKGTVDFLTDIDQ